MPTNDLPIDPELLRKKMAIPELLAELSYKDEKEAIRLMRQWGERKVSITPMYEELASKLLKDKVS